MSSESTNHGDSDSNAGGGRHEVVRGEREHLREIAHRRFAAVILPVGVCREADRGVKGKPAVDGRLTIGVMNGRCAMQAKDEVRDDDAGQGEQHHHTEVAQPVLLLVLAHAAQLVNGLFHRTRDGQKEKRARRQTPCSHVVAEERHDRRDDCEKRDTICARPTAVMRFLPDGTASEAAPVFLRRSRLRNARGRGARRSGKRSPTTR